MGATTTTASLYPSAFDTTDHAYASISDQDNAVGKPATSTSGYAQINLTTGSQAETYFYYLFDVSEIPADATIDSVTCTVRCLISSTSSSYIPTRTLQLFSGTTAKGNAVTISSTSANTYTLTTGTWTRAELDSLKLKFYAKRGSSSTSTSRYFRFYGATLAITYTYQDNRQTIYVKNNGVWTEYGNVYKKVNGVWVLQDRLDMTGLFNAATNYIRGVIPSDLPEVIMPGDTPFLFNPGAANVKSTSSLQATGLTLTIPKSGTYRIRWGMYGADTGYTTRSRLYCNGTAIGTEESSSVAKACSLDYSFSAGDEIELYFRGFSDGWYSYGGCGGLCACIDWNNGFNTGATGGEFSGTPVAGDTAVMYSPIVFDATSSSSLVNSGVSLTIPKAGTYKFVWSIGGGASGYSMATRLYQNGTAVGTQQTSSGSAAYTLTLTCAAGDVITAYFKGATYMGETWGGCGGLAACIDWDITLGGA